MEAEGPMVNSWPLTLKSSQGAGAGEVRGLSPYKSADSPSLDYMGQGWSDSAQGSVASGYGERARKQLLCTRK